MISSCRVLIVDDEPQIREIIVALLEHGGHYQVIQAENGQDGIEQALSEPAPKLIILDLEMPVMNGLEFLEIRDSNPRLRAIPVIVITAHPFVSQEQLKADLLLHKPFDLETIRIAVERYCLESLPKSSSR